MASVSSATPDGEPSDDSSSAQITVGPTVPGLDGDQDAPTRPTRSSPASARSATRSASPTTGRRTPIPSPSATSCPARLRGRVGHHRPRHLHRDAGARPATRVVRLGRLTAPFARRAWRTGPDHDHRPGPGRRAGRAPTPTSATAQAPGAAAGQPRTARPSPCRSRQRLGHQVVPARDRPDTTSHPASPRPTGSGSSTTGRRSRATRRHRHAPGRADGDARGGSASVTPPGSRPAATSAPSACDLGDLPPGTTVELELDVFVDPEPRDRPRRRRRQHGLGVDGHHRPQPRRQHEHVHRLGSGPGRPVDPQDRPSPDRAIFPVPRAGRRRAHVLRPRDRQLRPVGGTQPGDHRRAAAGHAPSSAPSNPIDPGRLHLRLLHRRRRQPGDRDLHVAVRLPRVRRHDTSASRWPIDPTVRDGTVLIEHRHDRRRTPPTATPATTPPPPPSPCGPWPTCASRSRSSRWTRAANIVRQRPRQRGPLGLPPGHAVSFVVQVTNDGPSAAADVQFIDAFPLDAAQLPGRRLRVPEQGDRLPIHATARPATCCSPARRSASRSSHPGRRHPAGHLHEHGESDDVDPETNAGRQRRHPRHPDHRPGRRPDHRQGGGDVAARRRSTRSPTRSPCRPA